MVTGLLKMGLIFSLTFIIQPCMALSQEPSPIAAAVSILPQRYFVEKIGGQFVKVEVMVLPGGTPEAYEPKPRQMTALSRARLYFACGVPFETVWLPKLISVNPKILVIHTEKDIRKRALEAHWHPGEGVKPHGGHSHEEQGKDPHVWLSPPLVILQARAIFEALAATDPQNRAFYEANYRNFASELVELDVFLWRLFWDVKSRTFAVFHPAWGYFADAYGLRQAPVEVEGREPKARELDEFIERARELEVKAIFVQPQYSPKAARTIADALGCKLIEADDLAPDWGKNIRQVAEQIKRAVNNEQ